MTRKELKNIKDAWAISEGYDNYIDLLQHINSLEQQPLLLDSLLIFAMENSHKYVK